LGGQRKAGRQCWRGEGLISGKGRDGATPQTLTDEAGGGRNPRRLYSGDRRDGVILPPLQY